MGSYSNQHRFAVTRLGAVAGDVLSHDGVARVAAVFDHSFYLDAAGGMACIINPNLELGPLNAVSSAPPDMNWRASGLRTGERVVLSVNTVYIGGRFVIALDGASHWQPAPVARNWSPVSLGMGLDHLNQLAGCHVPEDGLARLVFHSEASSIESHVLRRAIEPVDGLCSWLAFAMGNEATRRDEHISGVERLLGLGPGLTPAGDDFLGGVMIVLHALGKRCALKILAKQIGGAMAERTTAISGAHLSAAMSGMSSAPLHDLLHGILSGDDASLTVDLVRVARIGHTSGWDCLAGMVATLRVWLTVERSKHTMQKKTANLA